MESRLHLHTVVKKKKVRVCHLITLKLSSPKCAELESVCKELTDPSDTSSQAAAVTKIVDISQRSDVLGSGVQVLTTALLQCPVKANLAGKIIGSLKVLRSFNEEDFDHHCTQCLLSYLATATPDNIGAVCQVLELIQNTSLLQSGSKYIKQEESNNIQHRPTDIIQCSNVDTKPTTSVSSPGGVGTITKYLQITNDAILPTKIKLHEIICQNVRDVLQGLWSSLSDDSCTHISASTQLDELQQVVTSTLHYLQPLMPLHATTQCNEYNNKYLPDVFALLTTVLTAPKSTLDLRLICGHVLAFLSKFVVNGGPVALIEKTALGEQSGNEDKYSLQNFEVSRLPVLARVAIYHGILCTVPAEKLFESKVCEASNSSVCNRSSEGAVLGMVIMEQAIELGSTTDDSELVLSCARLLNHWTLRVLSHTSIAYRLILYMPTEGKIEKRLLDHLWFTWEHYLDRVKHTTFDTFLNFLEIRKNSLLKESELYFMTMIHNQISLVSSKKSAINAIRCLVKYVSVQKVLDIYPHFPSRMVNSLLDYSRAGCCSEVLKALFTKHINEVKSQYWQQYWVPILFDQFKSEMMTFGFELLVKNLMIVNPSCISFAINYILQQSEILSYDRFMLLMTCVKVTRNTKEIKPQERTEFYNKSSALWKNVLPYYIIQSCIFHLDERVQISAFGLLCDSKKTTEVFDLQELKLIIDFFTDGLCIDIPSQRQVLNSFAKKMYLRIRDSGNSLKKKEFDLKNKQLPSFSDSDAQKAINKTLLNYSWFCKTLFSTLLQNFHVSSSYPRRTSSLSLMKNFQEILLVCPQLVEMLDLEMLMFNKITVHTLIESLHDDYETNKIMVLSILINIPNVYKLIAETDVHFIFNCILTMSSSCKPPETLTSTYLLKFIHGHPILPKICCESATHRTNYHISLMICDYILEKLKEEVTVASQDLTTAASVAPMYGSLSCIRTAIEVLQTEQFCRDHTLWRNYVKKLIDICFLVGNIVLPIVENDSPEGNVPMDLEVLQEVVKNSIGNQNLNGADILPDDSSTDMIKKAISVSAQMLLICAWRSVKEVALILGNLVQVLPIPPVPEAVMDTECITRIGEYFLSVLAETKHRGAFEQSYAGFVMVCETLWRCKDQHLNSLPFKWVENILNDIQSEDEERFCATRRSAGVPFIVQAILATEPDCQGSICLSNTMTTLLDYAQHQRHNYTTRLHSFNILRAVYRDTKLGDHIVPYASLGVMAAINGFNSTHWSIRNSATLLFASLINRMLGVKRNKDDLHATNTMSGLVFFKRFPDLYTFLLNKIEFGADEIHKGMIAASIYPVLLLLARLSPAPLEGITSSLCLGHFVPHVIRCTKAQIYQLRDLSSKALGPLVTMNNLQSTLTQLFDQARSSNQNSIHGALLSIHKLLQTFSSHLTDDKQKISILSDIISLFPLTSDENPCLLTRSVAINIFRFIVKNKWMSARSNIVERLVKSFIDQFKFNKASTNIVHITGSHFHERAITHFLLELGDLTVNQIDILKLLLSSTSSDVRLLTLSHFENTPVSLDAFDFFLEFILNEEDVTCRISGYRLIAKFLSDSSYLRQKESNDQYFHYKKDMCRNYSVETLLNSLKVRLLDADEINILAIHEDELVSVIPLLIQLCSHVDPSCSWMLELLLEWSASEQQQQVRCHAATATVATLRAALLPSALQLTDTAPRITDRDLVYLFECLCMQLQDDELSVRSEAAQCWAVLVALAGDSGSAQPHNTSLVTAADKRDGGNSSRVMEAARKAIRATVGEELYDGCVTHLATLRPSQALKGLLHFVGCLGTDECISFLLVLALREQETDDFGLSQGDDRAFDKGEVNAHNEELLLAYRVSDVLLGAEISTNYVISKDSVVPHLLCVEGGNGGLQMQDLPSNMSLVQFLQILSTEIVLVSNQLSNSVKSKLILQVHGSSTWLVRLGRRAAVWATLIDSVSIDNDDLRDARTAVRGAVHVLETVHLYTATVDNIMKHLNI